MTTTMHANAEGRKVVAGNVWKRLGRSQQNQLLLLFCACLLGGYGVWFSGLHKTITDTENRISRLQNRIETRAADLPQPQSSATTERQIADLQAQLELDQRTLERLLQRFVPLDNAQQQQTLRRELSTLASGLGMRVIKLESALRRSNKVAEAPDPGAHAHIDRHYGRPLLLLEVWGTYFALQTLLDELDTLSYTVAPVNLQVSADEPKMTARQAMEVPQLLRIEMVLAI
jgi:hypothetical protein